MQTISKSDAISAGLDRYFTAKPRVSGHISARYISGNCIACRKEKDAIRRVKEREKRRAASLKYYYANRARLNARKKRLYREAKARNTMAEKAGK